MGLFDFFKQPQREARKSLDDALDHLLPRIFPGGREEINFRAKKVVELSNGKLDNQVAAYVFGKAKTRVWMAGRTFDGEKDLGVKARDLMDLTQADSGGKLSSFEAASIVFYAVFDKIDPSINAQTAIEGWSTSVFGSDDVGTDMDEIPQGIGEFGRDPTNPIPVRGILSSVIYFERLRTKHGRKVEYKRLRSLTAPNIFGNIDEYQISDAGQPICNLYLSPYNRRISRQPPEGFLLVQKD